jgi:hypothetical protein
MRFHLRTLLITWMIGPPLFVAAWLGFRPIMLTWILVTAFIWIVSELLMAAFCYGSVWLTGRLPGGDDGNDAKS